MHRSPSSAHGSNSTSKTRSPVTISRPFSRIATNSRSTPYSRASARASGVSVVGIVSVAISGVLQVEQGVGQLVRRRRQGRPIAVSQGRPHLLHQPLELGPVLRLYRL